MTEAGFPDLLKVATVLKSNGTHGDLLVGFRGILPEDLENEEPVYVYFDGLPVPFFIEKCDPRGSSRAIMHLLGVDSLKDAEEMVSRDIYMDASPLDDETDDEADLTGWTVLDENGDLIGTITGVEDIPGNPCAYLRRPTGPALVIPDSDRESPSSQEAMIPLHPDFIIDMDPATRCITMSLPAGLL